MRKNSGVRVLGFSLAFILAAPNLRADMIPADRLPLPGTWESAGVEGGIPNRATVCADVTKAPYNADSTGAASAVTAIQSAIDGCPDGQVVYVPAGTYLIDNGIGLMKPVTLRGAGPTTIFHVTAGKAVSMGRLGPWPPPHNNSSYYMDVTGGSTRGSTTVNVADSSAVAINKMISIDEIDDPSLVWTRDGTVGRFRSSMHMVTSKTPTSVTFRPPLPIDYSRSPHLSWYPDLYQNMGVENINFVGTVTNPWVFMEMSCCWNCWVLGCEFSAMPSKTIMVDWSSHIELRKNYMHDQSNGGPNSEGLDLLTDANWCLIIDNTCVAAGFPQINIGDGGANPNYAGGFGNVIAYNYAIDSYYTDPPTSTNAGKMTSDIGTNHSPHTQYNLVEGNIVGKFGSDGYHGSGSHSLFFRNIATGDSRWPYVDHKTAVQIDKRNLYYSLVGNVFGKVGSPTTYEYATVSGWNGTTIYRLGFPDMGNDGYAGTFPPTDLLHGDGGPRDLYVDRNNTANGTTIIEGNWDSNLGHQDWTVPPEALPDSYFLTAKPNWFGSLTWPPIDPAHPVTNDPTLIPAGYRTVHGMDPPSGPSAAPSVTLQPTDQTVQIGKTGTFLIGVAGNPAPTFQWRKNGTPISGAAGISYTTPAVAPGDDGSKFSCVVTNSLGSITSNSATLTVTQSAPGATPTPTIIPSPTPGGTASTETGFKPFKTVFNPMKERLVIPYSVAGSDNDFSLIVYDRAGNEVRVLDKGSGGQTRWDGKNNRGSIVASGSYVLILKQGNKVIKKKIVVVK